MHLICVKGDIQRGRNWHIVFPYMVEPVSVWRTNTVNGLLPDELENSCSLILSSLESL